MVMFNSYVKLQAGKYMLFYRNSMDHLVNYKISVPEIMHNAILGLVTPTPENPIIWRTWEMIQMDPFRLWEWLLRAKDQNSKHILVVCSIYIYTYQIYIISSNIYSYSTILGAPDPDPKVKLKTITRR